MPGSAFMSRRRGCMRMTMFQKKLQQPWGLQLAPQLQNSNLSRFGPWVRLLMRHDASLCRIGTMYSFADHPKTLRCWWLTFAPTTFPQLYFFMMFFWALARIYSSTALLDLFRFYLQTVPKISSSWPLTKPTSKTSKAPKKKNAQDITRIPPNINT